MNCISYNGCEQQGKADALRVELQQAGDRKDKGFAKTKVRLLAESLAYSLLLACFHFTDNHYCVSMIAGRTQEGRVRFSGILQQ